MVCYLKQFDYLLLQRWPKEHQRLADLMALDRIPRLIRLFRSLVRAIETTLEPQGYGKMAETVLQWLSMDDEANLKVLYHNCIILLYVLTGGSYPFLWHRLSYILLLKDIQLHSLGKTLDAICEVII